MASRKKSAASEAAAAAAPDATAEEYARVRELVDPHVKSFNFFLEEGKDLLLKHLDPVSLRTEDQGSYQLSIEDISIGMPMLLNPHSAKGEENLYPHDCREGRMTYGALSTVRLRISGGPGKDVLSASCSIGRLPVMVGSKRCWIGRVKPEGHAQQLAQLKEDPYEVGGYFIVNGLEKLLRMLIYARPNHPLAVVRPSWANKGPHYTKFGVNMRCMRSDSTTQSITVHYLSSGEVTLRFIFRKQEFFIPAVLLLKAMTGISDRAIYERLVMNDSTNTALANAAEMVLRARENSSAPQIHTPGDALAFIGSRFRIVMADDSKTDAEIGRSLIDRFIFVHLDSYADKADLLLFCMQKLFALVNGDIEEDNVDSPMTQALLLPGHLYLAVFKDRLQEWLFGVRAAIVKDMALGKPYDLTKESYWKTKAEHVPPVGRRMEMFLATGVHNSRSGIDLMQTAGFSIIADKLNFMRFMSHFHSVHRGSFYAEMKTTAIRKLMPESWGFMCPVHTPDGAPCGLLNHLSMDCRVESSPVSKTQEVAVEKLLAELGVANSRNAVLPPNYVTVLYNGRVMGKLPGTDARRVQAALRLAKITRSHDVPLTLEVAIANPSGVESATAGVTASLVLSSDMGRMVRPVQHRPTGLVSWIGAFEQVYMDIALPSEPDEVAKSEYCEFNNTNQLSVLANFIPFPDMNQSPRNMYQCQMAKQTLGIPCHSYEYRTDNKLLRLHYPQKPICVTRTQKRFAGDHYPSGANAVIAMVSYTGYDMEDALILNKASVERGWAHASMYKTIAVDLSKERMDDRTTLSGINPQTKELVSESLDFDGLPRPGEIIRDHTAIYSVVSPVEGKPHVKAGKGEQCVVDQVRVMPTYSEGLASCNDETAGSLRKANIKMRYNRNPVIGDKFAARHGQKGVLSQLWPQRNMPFTESGMTPDVIINPHAFPSRMTIGMLIEAMAGKAGAMYAEWQDASPFRYNERDTAVAHFGEQLKKAGYCYYGTEPMYSGVTGEPFEAQVYIGIVYYQRLVHQVKDKFQVRSFGPVNELTQQPVHGRKRGGGIRFGEMERDSLLAHGTSMLLHDRLFNCSDRSLHYVCRKCGTIIGALPQRDMGLYCKTCKTSSTVEPLLVPYVLRYLTAELAACGIRLTVLTK
eukprot:m51a1_g164 putative dna-directed rna polymerase i subunit (1144) ;mRNA; f:530198-534292